MRPERKGIRPASPLLVALSSGGLRTEFTQWSYAAAYLPDYNETWTSRFRYRPECCSPNLWWPTKSDFWVRDCGLLPAPKRDRIRFPKVHRALCLYFLPHLNRRHCPGAYPSRRHTRASVSYTHLTLPTIYSV